MDVNTKKSEQQIDNKRIYVLGVGNNTLVYIDLVESCGYEILGLYHYDDSRTGELFHGYKILGSTNDLYSAGDLSSMNFALSQGDNRIRAEVFNKILSLNGSIPTLIHPKATVSKYAKLGCGVVIHVNSVIHPDTSIGDNTVFSYNTAITHNSSIGSHCYLASNSMIGAYTKVGDYVFMGIGVSTISAKVSEIGDSAYIGAGSLITKSVESGTVMMGSPARVVKRVVL